MDDRRSLVSHTYVGIEESGPFMAWAAELDVTPRRLFARSERLWLGLMDGRSRDGSDAELTWLAVFRYNLDGQLDLMVGFDEDQLRPALDELNRLDLEMSDLQRRATVSALYDGAAWSGRFDPEGYFMRPDVTWVDHRHLAIQLRRAC